MSGNNEKRADSAEVQVRAFALEHLSSDLDEALRDLLADMAHLCRRYSRDPRDAFEKALLTFEEEEFEDGGPAKRKFRVNDAGDFVSVRKTRKPQ